MPDGTRLAARIWRPAGSGQVPAILEYIPYRKRYGTAVRDAVTQPYLAGHGYACVRVDLRGSGESGGVLTDEYLPTELADGIEVIRWIASQDWCDGNVGMMGISWGGFNGLQIAALQPPELKAIVTLCSTDDRYADDIHHMGGTLLADNLSWASVMFAYNTMPPDPAVVGERWRDEWLRRLEGSGLWLETWLRHQRRDEYWRHGSVCEDYSAIRCPVYAVSGWADGYSNAVFRLLSNLSVPTKGLIGPWSHVYPHLGNPGPAIGFLQELLRWWDRWLKDIDTGIMDEPALRVWMQNPAPPAFSYVERPGRWVAEDGWPSSRIVSQQLSLRPDGQLAPDPQEGELTIDSPLWVGRYAGKWCSYVAGPDLPGDQRHDDAGSVVFETEPLTEPIEILGAPVVSLVIGSDRPVAQLAVRLNDVQPDGEVTRVTYGLLNLTHRTSHEEPNPLKPGRSYPVTIQMNGIAQRFEAGHRLRLSVSGSYWPLAWPAPEPTRLTLDCVRSHLTLPVRPTDHPADSRLPSFEEPEGSPPHAQTTLEEGHHTWKLHHDLGTDIHTLEVINDNGLVRHDEIGLEVGFRVVERYSIRTGQPSSARGEVTTHRSLRRDEWSIRTFTHTTLSGTPDHFVVEAEMEAVEGEETVFTRTWSEEIPRDLV